MKLNTLARMILPILFVALLITATTASSLPENINAIKRPDGSLINNLPNRPDRPWIDGTYEMHWREKKQASVASNPVAESSMLESTLDTDFEVIVGDFALGVDYPQNFRFVMEGDHCYIYVAYDLVAPFYNYYDSTTGEYVFENPKYPVGGWTAEDRISTAQLAYIMNEFDSNVYPVMTATFGYPNERPAGETKIYLLMMNIRDESYYDYTETSFIIGYFSHSEDVDENKNMIHFDSYDWARRLGPAGGFAYESTLAHEFEHLIHNDIDSDEESWIDEGCAMMSEYLCGYGHSNTHIYYYFVYHPYTSLTVWGGELWNYGVDYLFMLYLYEHYGGTEFIVDLVKNQLNSIDGVVDTLADHGYTISFDQVFHNWAIANYIDDTSIGNGEYGYYTLDIPSRDTRGASIQWSLWNFWVGLELNRGYGLPPPDGVAPYWDGAVQPYTAQYWEYGFTPAGFPATFYYGGDPYAGPSPHSPLKQWYGGAGNWVWRQLHQTFDIPASGATLNFWTNYNIELNWDYGYVEVHDLTDDTWTTLKGINTVDTLPHVQDNPNTPADREPAHYFATAGKWNAFTGNSGGYYKETMNLLPFAGHSIELYFMYWTDGAANEVGFFVDDISIPEIGFTDHADTVGDWVAIPADGWMLTSGTDFPNNWQGTVMDVTGVRAYRNPTVRWNLRNGKMINFQPGQLYNVFEFTDVGPYNTLTIPPNYVNQGHTFTAVFWNGVPYLFSGNYWFFAV
jgi:hypothetical protein